ncbi:antitermination protein Q [Metapseudomonas lalkuanensis]|uniref:antiterminator Q family protein n=1 Tax=Metapseudomonas lalkuanensis TaxID=2604832 RepID=UPI001CF12ABD|nr:antiterminator Q family protein [Pseudomonas lalkuanensis]UCP00088.1 antitermination protein Q [Pseudomonas lalkuanensis]
MKKLSDTEWMLEQWGWWRMNGAGVPRYVSPACAMMRDNVGSTVPIGCITDELAMTIDGIVARLCKRDPQMGDCVWLYFGAKWAAVKVGRQNGVSEAKARELIKSGVAWVDSRLEYLREAA